MLDTRGNLTKYIYIVGSGHSGSTLLELLISNCPRVFAMGEASRIHSAFKRNSLCSCGVSIRDCQQWQEILPAFTDSTLRIYGYGSDSAVSLAGEKAVAFSESYHELLEQVRRGTGCSVFTDSSKSLSRLVALSRIARLDLRVLYIRRHAGGVIKSQMRKGRSFYGQTLVWVKRNIEITRFLKKSNLRWLLVSYEDLALDVVTEMSRIFDFLGEKYDSHWATDFSRKRHLIEGNRIRLRHQHLSVHAPASWREDLSALRKAVLHVADYMGSLGAHGGRS